MLGFLTKIDLAQLSRSNHGFVGKSRKMFISQSISLIWSNRLFGRKEKTKKRRCWPMCNLVQTLRTLPHMQ